MYILKNAFKRLLKKKNSKSKHSPGLLAGNSQLHPLRPALTREAARAARLGVYRMGKGRSPLTELALGALNLQESFSSAMSAIPVKPRFCWYN